MTQQGFCLHRDEINQLRKEVKNYLQISGAQIQLAIKLCTQRAVNQYKIPKCVPDFAVSCSTVELLCNTPHTMK